MNILFTAYSVLFSISLILSIREIWKYRSITDNLSVYVMTSMWLFIGICMQLDHAVMIRIGGGGISPVW